MDSKRDWTGELDVVVKEVRAMRADPKKYNSGLVLLHAEWLISALREHTVELDRLRGAVGAWCANHCQRENYCVTCPLRNDKTTDTGGRG